MNRLVLAAAALSVVFISGCYNYVDGGPSVSETRSVEGYDALRVDDGLRVTFQKGETSQVTVDAPEKVMQYLDTKVKNGQLVIGLRSGVTVTTFDTIVITASSPSIDTLEATGGSKLTAKDLSANPLRVTASGGSDIEITGASADLRVNASGGSGVTADQFAADAVSVDASGGSTVKVQALKSLVGSATGGSTVTVTGGGDISKFSASGGSTLN
ncbi:MAG: DUF2807 domain-containing protein [Archangium sp.]